MSEYEEDTRRIIGQLRHADLLIAIVSLLVIQSFLTTDNHLGSSLLNALFFVVVLASVKTLARSRRPIWVALLTGCMAYGLSWVVEFYPSTPIAIATCICFIMVFSQLIVVLAQNVFAEGPVDSNRIIGAISIYFLIGINWAFVYAVLELASPGSFRLTAETAGKTTHSGLIGELMYFSQVTLTTLGYGDVVPLSNPARMLTSLQAMIGQLYIAIVIARLVSIQISQGRDA